MTAIDAAPRITGVIAAGITAPAVALTIKMGQAANCAQAQCGDKPASRAVGKA